MDSRTDFDLILVKASGTVLVTLALLKLPDTFKALMQVISTLAFTTASFSDEKIDKLMSHIMQVGLASALGEIVAFIILLLLARWMFGFPKFMRNAFRRSNRSSLQPRKPGLRSPSPHDPGTQGR